MQEVARLRIIAPDGQTREVPVAPGVTTIGEYEGSHIVLTGPGIASRHAQFLCDEHGCRLMDLGSSAGTRVNGRAISANLARRLQPGDVIEIGDYRLHFESLGKPVSTQPAPSVLDLRASSDAQEVEKMSRGRQHSLVLWIIGALGVVAAIGLVAVLAWVLLMGPGKGVSPTATPTIVAGLVTDTPAGPTPTTPPILLATATPTQPLPPPTRITVVPENTAIIVPPTPTSGLTPLPTWTPVAPTPTNTPAVWPTWTPVAPLPTWTPAPWPTWTPAVPPPTPSPWAMVNAANANVRAGPSTQYPVITQVHYGEYVLLLGQSADYSWYYIQLNDGRLGWIAASLVNRSPGLALPIVPAPPLPPTPVPPPPTWTPIPIPPTWTPIPPPTSTWTPLPPPPCPLPIGAPFIAPWTGDVRDTLQCPTDVMRETWTAIQRFERGIMFWREDQRMIYIIADDHTWRKVSDNWVDGMPEYSCPDAPPAGLVKPKRGFGYVWCNEPGIKSLVGWGVEEEHGFTTQFQSFEGGEMMRAENNTVYILMHSGWWESYP